MKCLSSTGRTSWYPLFRKLVFLALLPTSLSAVINGSGATWYVATNGVDTNDGSISSPLGTVMKAQTMAHSGDIVWLRGGTYYPTNISHYNTPGVPWNVINYMTNNGISY